MIFACNISPPEVNRSCFQVPVYYIPLPASKDERVVTWVNILGD